MDEQLDPPRVGRRVLIHLAHEVERPGEGLAVEDAAVRVPEVLRRREVHDAASAVPGFAGTAVEQDGPERQRVRRGGKRHIGGRRPRRLDELACRLSRRERERRPVEGRRRTHRLAGREGRDAVFETAQRCQRHHHADRCTLAGADAVSRRPTVVTGIEEVDRRPPQRLERQRLVGSVGAHHRKRVALDPRLAHHVEGIDALEEAPGRQHPGNRPCGRAPDGVDPDLGIVALTQSADRAEQRCERAALVCAECDRARDRERDAQLHSRRAVSSRRVAFRP